MKTSRKFVLFDFDGVITDSYALAYGVAKECHPHLDHESYRKLFEGNVYDHLKEMECNDECKSGFEAHFSRTLERKHEIRLFPGMEDVIRTLAVHYDMAIISSSIEELIHHVLDPRDLTKYFKEIMDAQVHQNKAQKNKSILGTYDLQPRDCIFITDTLGDMHEARHVGIDAIAVAWGFHDRATLEQGEPITIVERPEDLPAAIDAYFAGAS